MMFHTTVKRTVLLVFMLLAVLALAACNDDGGSDETDPNAITDILWQWETVSVQGTIETTVPNPEDYTLTFREDGTFDGQNDCNSIAGTWSQEGGFFVTVGPSTLVACGEESLDSMFLDLLSQVVAGGPDSAGGFALENAGGEKRMAFSNGGEG